MATGRYAPSPTAELHLGNLRTAVAAWLLARSAGSRFVMRVEDLDPATRHLDLEAVQLADLEALGIDWDGPVVRQSDRLDAHHRALASLETAGSTFRCYCTRREIREATQAAHEPVPRYPGTCRDLDARARAAREASGRPAALRLRGEGRIRAFDDRIAGRHEGPVDDVVIRRNDGTPAYHLAVVVDDAHQGVEEVVRGDDLLPATPAQIALREELGLDPVEHAHVPLVYGPTGERLAKRDGAVSLSDLAAIGVTPAHVVARIGRSLGLIDDDSSDVTTAGDLLERFTHERVQWVPWHLTAADIGAEDAPG